MTTISPDLARQRLGEILGGWIPCPEDPEFLAALMDAASTQQFVRLHDNIIDTYGADRGEALWESARSLYAEESAR